MTSKEKLEDIVYSDKSSIHGTGLFAKRKIKKGEYIGTYEGPKAKRNGTYVLWVYEEEGEEPIGRCGKNLLRYLNHSVSGNAEFDGFDLYACKKIALDDEITFDYKEFD